MKTLSIIIPCFNEVNTIQEIIERVRASDITLQKQIIVIDDCSTDGTSELLNKLLKHQVDIIYSQTVNRGKGSAIRKGLEFATGDVLLIQDADLEYDPGEYSKLLAPILENKADVVYGSRFLSTGPRRVIYFWHKVGNTFLTLLSNVFTNLDLTDMETCYKVFTKSVASQLTINEDRFGIEPEITARISKMNVRIYEVGISYYGRTYADGKKIGWRDGFRAIYCIVKYNLR
jgi:glycosyltransferase involved in cell wall biosynthesis